MRGSIGSILSCVVVCSLRYVLGAMALYAKLSLAPDASPEQIRESFHAIALQLHPDKQGTAELRRAAEKEFHALNEMYDVLRDPVRRQAYDEFGMEGVRAVDDNENGLQELADVRDSEEFRAQVLSVLQEAKQRQLEAKLHISGAMIMDLDATDMLDWLSPTMPEVTQFVIQQNAELPLSAQDRLTISAYAVTKHGMGFGSMRLHWRNATTKYRTVETAVDIGNATKLTCTASQQLNEHCLGAMEASLASDTLGLSLSATQQISEDTEARMEIDLTPGKGQLSMSAARKTEKTETSGEFQLAHNDVNLSGSWLWHLSPRNRFKLGAKAGIIRPVELEAVGGRTLSARSRMNVGVALGMQGVSLRLRFQRGVFQFSVPILLSASFSPLAGIGAALVPSILTLMVQQLMRPATKRREDKKQVEGEAARIAVQRAARCSAQTQVKLMQRASDANRDAEVEKDGLVILSGRYGRAVREQQTPSSTAGKAAQDTANWIDVTMQLQFFVKVSEAACKRAQLPPTLQLPPFFPLISLPPSDTHNACLTTHTQNSCLRLQASSKAGLLGFYRPTVPDSSALSASDGLELLVRYSLGGNVFEIVVNDRDPCFLPARRALCLGASARVV